VVNPDNGVCNAAEAEGGMKNRLIAAHLNVWSGQGRIRARRDEPKQQRISPRITRCEKFYAGSCTRSREYM